jgi:hypothetical protein
MGYSESMTEKFAAAFSSETPLTDKCSMGQQVSEAGHFFSSQATVAPDIAHTDGAAAI